jgi:hypothetical protein
MRMVCGAYAIGGGLLADVVEDDLGPSAAVQDDPCRRDQQVADARRGRCGQRNERRYQGSAEGEAGNQ